MLNTKERIKKEGEIKTLFKKGRSFFGDIIGVKIMKNSFENTRFVVMVGKKVHKRAVRRNKIRRRIRASLSSHSSSILPGFDIAIIARPSSVDSDYKDIDKSLVVVLKKAGVFKDD